MITQIQTPVYNHYSTVEGNICNGQVLTGCSFSNLTYNQWFRGSVLLYPLPGIDQNLPAIETSYTIFYRDYTLLLYPPEVYYYDGRSS